jgi:hypothetical protein
MNSFAIGHVGVPAVQAKRKLKAGRNGRRRVRMMVGGEMVKLTPRAARIVRLARKALKGVEVPPRR